MVLSVQFQNMVGYYTPYYAKGEVEPDKELGCNVDNIFYSTSANSVLHLL